jgi:hypothetical protein
MDCLRVLTPIFEKSCKKCLTELSDTSIRRNLIVGEPLENTEELLLSFGEWPRSIVLRGSDLKPGPFAVAPGPAP